MKVVGNKAPKLSLDYLDLCDLRDAMVAMRESAKKGVEFWQRLVKDPSVTSERLKMRKVALDSKTKQLKRCDGILQCLDDYEKRMFNGYHVLKENTDTK